MHLGVGGHLPIAISHAGFEGPDEVMRVVHKFKVVVQIFAHCRRIYHLRIFPDNAKVASSTGWLCSSGLQCPTSCDEFLRLLQQCKLSAGEGPLH